MYLSRLGIKNFRSCYEVEVELQPNITLLVGENNSGKSNVIEALRLATTPLNRPRGGSTNLTCRMVEKRKRLSSARRTTV